MKASGLTRETTVVTSYRQTTAYHQVYCFWIWFSDICCLRSYGLMGLLFGSSTKMKSMSCNASVCSVLKVCINMQCQPLTQKWWAACRLVFLTPERHSIHRMLMNLQVRAITHCPQQPSILEIDIPQRFSDLFGSIKFSTKLDRWALEQPKQLVTCHAHGAEEFPLLLRQPPCDPSGLDDNTYIDKMTQTVVQCSNNGQLILNISSHSHKSCSVPPKKKAWFWPSPPLPLFGGRLVTLLAVAESSLNMFIRCWANLLAASKARVSIVDGSYAMQKQLYNHILGTQGLCFHAMSQKVLLLWLDCETSLHAGWPFDI